MKLKEKCLQQGQSVWHSMLVMNCIFHLSSNCAAFIMFLSRFKVRKEQFVDSVTGLLRRLKTTVIKVMASGIEDGRTFTPNTPLKSPCVQKLGLNESQFVTATNYNNSIHFAQNMSKKEGNLWQFQIIEVKIMLLFSILQWKLFDLAIRVDSSWHKPSCLTHLDSTFL